MKRATRKEPVTFGVLFWIAVVLLFIIIFFVNKSTIDKVLEETKFFEVIRPEKNNSLSVTINNGAEEIIENTDSANIDIPGLINKRSDNTVLTTPSSTTIDEATDNPLDPARLLELAEGISTVVESISEPIEPIKTSPETQAEPDTKPTVASASTEQKASAKSRKARIYYVKVNNNSDLQMVAVEREVQYENNPMTETINTLLHGPSKDELSSGLLNLIPEGTKLISAWIRDGVAYLNFNEEFMFNSLGSEGTIGQLQQIIYSTTEFSTIEKVQILIEGKKVDYLSQEGIFVGRPLGRNS